MNSHSTHKSKNTKQSDNNIWQYILLIIITILIRIFVVEIFFVPTGSMKNTLMPGDYVLSTKYNYGYNRYNLPFNLNITDKKIFASKAKRGDVVIMVPPHDTKIMYVKRLIGMPGDKIEIKNNVTYINDIAVSRIEESIEHNQITNQTFAKFKETFDSGFSFYSYKDINIENYNKNNYGPYYVPQDHYFFLGDNRDHSGDSRYQLGFVHYKYFIGKPTMVLYHNNNQKPFFSNYSIAELLSLPMNIFNWLRSMDFSRSFMYI